MTPDSSIRAKLRQPLVLGTGHRLRNRVMALPAAGRAHVDLAGRPTSSMHEMYAERAAGGYGLVYVHATIVDPRCTTPAELILADAAALSPFSELADAIASHGALSGIQIISHWQKDFPYKMSELSTSEIEDMIARHVRGAELAAQAGFDVVNLQAGHGWPAQRFISRLTNDRQDRYGAPEYVVTRIAEAVRRAIGQDCAMSWRLSVNEFAGDGGITPALVKNEIMPALAAAGCDLFDLSLGRSAVLPKVRDFLANETTYSSHAQALRNFAGFREVTSVPVSVRGRITSFDGVAEALEYGDVVGVGRQTIADPNFANKVLGYDGARVRECIGCNYCLDRVVRQELPVRCAVNWSFGRRLVSPPRARPDQGRAMRLLVIGGGVAGLSAAAALARYGGSVVVREAADHLGGQLAGLSELRSLNLHMLTSLVDRLAHEAESAGVELCTSTSGDVEVEAASGEWDAVVVATGSRPQSAGVRLPKGVRPSRFSDLLGVDPSSVALLGSGGEGAEWAVELAARGWQVTVVDTSQSATATVYDYDARRSEALDEIFEQRAISRHDAATISQIQRAADGLLRMTVDRAGERTLVLAAHLMLFGRQPAADGATRFRAAARSSVRHEIVAGARVAWIGDCVRPMGIAEAVDAGEKAAIVLARSRSE